MIETYTVYTCDDRNDGFVGPGCAFTLFGWRVEVSLTRREAPQGRPAAAPTGAKPSAPDGARPASEGESQ